MATSYKGKASLVVDDDRAVRLILRRMLEGLGFEVEDAPDGVAALRATSFQPFDLVITDLSMPGMDGMEFFRKARAGGLKAPVIFLTAMGSSARATEAMEAGASDFMEKPMRIKSLEEAVHLAMSSKPPDDGSLSIKIDLDDLEL